jgi:transcription initiation factor IIF auxiliary subunit
MAQISLHLEQGYQYRGNDYWDWWIWLEGSEAELREVQKVVYTLHRTFPNPVRSIEDRDSKFMLKTAGWGVFRVYAQVHKIDGTGIKLQHDLQLEYPDGTPTQA